MTHEHYYAHRHIHFCVNHNIHTTAMRVLDELFIVGPMRLSKFCAWVVNPGDIPTALQVGTKAEVRHWVSVLQQRRLIPSCTNNTIKAMKAHLRKKGVSTEPVNGFPKIGELDLTLEGFDLTNTDRGWFFNNSRPDVTAIAYAKDDKSATVYGTSRESVEKCLGKSITGSFHITSRTRTESIGPWSDRWYRVCPKGYKTHVLLKWK